jgi:hypothetical protein
VAGPERERAFMARWLAGELASGDRIVADIYGFTGARPRWDLLQAPIIAAAAIEGWHDFFYGPLLSRSAQGPIALLGIVCSALSAVLACARKRVYLAVTDRQIVAVQMRTRQHPVRVLFSRPIHSVQLTTRDGLLRTIIWASADGGAISVAGQDRARVRLTTRGRRARFDDVLNAVRAQGGAVDLPPPPVVAMQLPTTERGGVR